MMVINLTNNFKVFVIHCINRLLVLELSFDDV